MTRRQPLEALSRWTHGAAPKVLGGIGAQRRFYAFVTRRARASNGRLVTIALSLFTLNCPSSCGAEASQTFNPVLVLVHDCINHHHLSLHLNSPKLCISSLSFLVPALSYGLCTFNLCLYPTAVTLCLVSILRLSPQCPTDFLILQYV